MSNGNDKKIPGLGHLMSVPIIGRKLDDKGIELLENVLAQMREGKLISVALVAERDNGEVLMSFSHGLGQPVRTIGSLAVLSTALSLGIVQGGAGAAPPPSQG